METETHKIVYRGMGFLSPPTHPEHDYSVSSFRGAREVGGTSLSSAVNAEFLSEPIRRSAAGILSAWKAPAVDSPEVQGWILQVLGYFRHCYRDPQAGEGEQWYADKLIISESSRGRKVEDHAGVHLIRRYYPEFTPTAEHFAGARWGS